MNNQPNRGRRNLRRVSLSRPQSRSVSPVHATLNRQNEFIGITNTNGIAGTLNAPGKMVRLGVNTRKNRPQSASYESVSRPQSPSTPNRPKSESLVRVQSMQPIVAQHGQLKTIHANLQRQQRSRHLLRTRRRKSRRAN
jgi:hypothetical protein